MIRLPKLAPRYGHKSHNKGSLVEADIECQVGSRELVISWSLSESSSILQRHGSITIGYPFEIDSTLTSLGNLIGVCAVVQFLGQDFQATVVRVKQPMDHDYFDLAQQICGTQARISATISSQKLRKTALPLGGGGLLMGGGIESTFAAMRLRDLQPVLIQICGPDWMNSDYSTYSNKERLENEFARNLGCTIVRVQTDLKRAFNSLDDLDEQINRLFTGAFFYYSAVPIARMSLQFLVKSSELEEALNFSTFDNSLNPRVWASTLRLPHWPIALSPFSMFPKIFMLAEIMSGIGKDYFSSCLVNSPKRWCGDCSKCSRVDEMLRTLSLHPSEVGLVMDGKKRARSVGYKKNYQFFNDVWTFLNKASAKPNRPRTRYLSLGI